MDEVWFLIQFRVPDEPGSTMAAAPEADVSDRPERPEAPPRALARRRGLSEPAGTRRTARDG